MATVIEKRERTAGRMRAKPRLRANVSQWGYQIIDIGTNEILYEAGNNPADSSPGQNLTPDTGAMSIEDLKSFAELTGKQIAREQRARWWGAQIRPLL